MSVAYRMVQWNPHKRRYDLAVVAGVLLYLAGFMAVSSLVWPGEQALSPPILLIRATGTCAALMLHIVLAIGPLARLDRRFLPLLYNRRHLGVATFLVALVHGVLVLGWYHGFGVVHPVESLFTSNTQYRSISAFPFETLGVAALLILFLMAATSHDFWLKNLSPAAWKRLHMAVYAAWGLVIAHVALGVMQTERSGVYPAVLLIAAATVAGLHLAAGLRSWRKDVAETATPGEWLDAGPVEAIPDRRAVSLQLPGGGAVAVFRHGTKLSAIAGRCVHQGGPLAEGKIVDGCVTCPWHGYQYRPEDGCSPPPYTEKLATHRVRLRAGRVEVESSAQMPGTPVEPAVIEEHTHAA